MTVQDALNQLIVVMISGFVGLALVGFAYVRTVINTRAKKIKDEADEAAKSRRAEYEQRMRNMEIAYRERVAGIEEKANASAAIISTLENLTGAFFDQNKQIALIPPELHATADALTNNTQTLGDMAEYVDNLALRVGENTDVGRAAREAADAAREAALATRVSIEQILTTELERAIGIMKNIHDVIMARMDKHKTGELVQVAGGLVHSDTPEA